ncbi:patatin-like phospholipase family protein [Streptomyces sp. TRM 70361]|uniref:patatin-like phospholipase family protein n=1 Tax=Streptomyces sp. TRM 70361 TaxID=3116553 RepID=UPI002E7ADD1D|nr:patatin-like phospholipase family protein [Streptomyces sp. TRM 70361]MEE1939685.1 patatin-like phospholipase family protein [Streptomyces sp. TRM 70361]
MADRALVLGSGGFAGGAWQVGVLAGLVEAGVDLAGADVVIGTSAGAVVGAGLVAGRLPEELVDGEPGPDGPAFAPRVTPGLALRFLRAQFGGPRTPRAVARRLGRMALAARTVPEAETVAAVAALLPVRDWPDGRLHVTAVDAETGEPGVFRSGGGADLPRAVTASCALAGLWPPVALGGRRWIDGGVWSTANAHLARGYDRVVVLAPLTRAFGPGATAGRQADRLRVSGARVALVTPGAAVRRALARNPLDPARRAACARAGRAQAAACARAVAEVWQEG